MSKVQEAIDWIYSNTGVSQYAAAKKFSIAQSAISVALNKHESDAAVYESLGAGMLNAVDAWLGGHPQATQKETAKQFSLPPNTLRAAYRGRDVVARRLRLAKEGAAVDPVAEMREKCAMLAEAIGGEHGVHIAAAIRGIL